jgi:hypothetical protein
MWFSIYINYFTNKCASAVSWKLLPVFFLSLLSSSLYAKEPANDPPYEEILVYVSIPRLGGQEFPALVNEQAVYLPITDLFAYLKINCKASEYMDTLSGFFIQPESKYLIDYTNGQIHYEGRSFPVSRQDLVKTETGLYLRADHFGKIFALECNFSFRSLSVSLDTKLELPFMRELRQEMMRRNVKMLKKEVKADTVLARRYPMLQGAMLDWSLMSVKAGKEKEDTRVSLRLGAMLAGGETTIGVSYNNITKFHPKQQYFNWRYVNNDKKAVRQVALGHIAPMSTSSIFAPVAGVQVSNTPTTHRRSFGTYILSNRTEPGWIVELYVNNVLVDYTRADASGFYSFEIPLLYGMTSVNLRFYGPSGEERHSEQNISIPFSFLPAKTFEYTLSAGMVQDGKNSRYSRAQFHYGLGKRVTMGGGLEYLSTLGNKSMPFVNTSIRASSNLLLSAEYMNHVRSRATLSYRRPSNLQAELNYTRYAKGQQAINTHYLEEKRLVVSMPMRTGNIFLFSRLGWNQFTSPTIGLAELMRTKYSDIPRQKTTVAEWMLSGAWSRWSSNVTTSAAFLDDNLQNVFSHLTIAYRSTSGWMLRHGMQFDYTRMKPWMLKEELERNIHGRGFINISYEKNFITRTGTFMAGLRYDLSFARTSYTASRSQGKTVSTLTANGSILYDKKTKWTSTSNRISTGRGGISIVPFLDRNCNGIRDAGEPGVHGLKFRINGGRVVRKKGSTVIRVQELEPYASYLLELEGNSFDDISWQIRKKAISVTVDPNCFKVVEVPVAVMGEASGMVYLAEGAEVKGLGRVLLHFYNSRSEKVAQTVTEADGFFSFLGLPPGQYTVRVDEAQLEKLKLSSKPGSLSFKVVAGTEGTFVTGLDFRLERRVVNGE